VPESFILATYLGYKVESLVPAGLYAIPLGVIIVRSALTLGPFTLLSRLAKPCISNSRFSSHSQLKALSFKAGRRSCTVISL